MESEPTPVIGGAAYYAPSGALLICFGLLQFIWVVAFFASVPILLAARTHRPRQMPWWLVSILAAASGWIASNGFAFLETMSIQAAQEAAFRQGYLADFWMWAPPPLTLAWGWIVGLVYLLVCLTAYPLFTSRIWQGLTLVAAGLFVATYVPPWATTDLFRAGFVGYFYAFVLFLLCAGVSAHILRTLGLRASWWPFIVMFSATLLIRLALRMALHALDHVFLLWPFESPGDSQVEWAALFAALFTAFWWIAIRERPETSSSSPGHRSEARIFRTAVARGALSAVTLFGGHFLNQRLDRVVLIATLLVSAVAISIGIPAATLYASAQWPMAAIWLPWLPLLLMSALLVISVALAFSDARRAAVGPPTTPSRHLRIPLSLFGVVVVAGLCFLGWAETQARAVQHREATPIAGRIEFGHGTAPRSLRTSFPAPPRGSESLRGRLLLNGVGIEDAAVSITLNDDYIAELESDSRGRFEVSLPPGRWHVNEIVLREWPGRPADRDLILISGYEPKRHGGMYSELRCYRSNGLPVTLPPASETKPIELEFRDAIDVTPMPAADLATATIAWGSVKGASGYDVQIFSLNDGPLESYSTPILTRHTSRPILQLASLPQRPAAAPEDEYAIRIFAFDAQGRLLTRTGRKADARSFRLSGAARLGEERQYADFDESLCESSRE